MSRTFTIEELNKRIDELIAEYEKEYPGYAEDYISALQDLKLELNSPEPLVNVTEKIQESLNIIETNKIIKDGL